MSEASTPPEAPSPGPAEAAAPPDPPARAPVKADDIDPDLVKLRRPRPQIGAVTAFAVVVMCAYLAIRLGDDRAFAGEPEQPREVLVDDAVTGRISPESHVAMSARIEHATAVRATVGPADPGLRIAPVIGSNDKLWLALTGHTAEVLALDGRYAGRLRRFDDVRFADPVREALARPQPRFVTGAELLAARTRSADGGAVITVAGAPATATGDTPVEVEVVDPGAATVIGTFNDRFPDAPAWTAALAQAGVIAAGTAPARTETGAVSYTVRTADAMAQTRQKVDGAGLFGARVEPVTARHRAPWRQLVVGPDRLTFPDGATLPWTAVDVVALWLPRAVPAGSVVLLAGEAPDQYWYVLPIYIAVLVFGALFLWAFVRAVRRDLLAAS